jgi:hypothetical protein
MNHGIFTPELREQLEQQRATRAELSRVLWAMTPEQRVAAMWARRLTWEQLREWTQLAPHEVPRSSIVGGEYMWIAMLTPEWLGE